MFNYIKKIQKRRASKVRNKIIIFSLISGVISAITALFFSSEENRQKVAEGTKVACQKIKETSLKAKEEIQKDIEKISQLAQEEGKKISSKFQRLQKQKEKEEELD